MKFKNLLLCTCVLLFVSCQKGYEQEYETFSEFDKRNARNKDWFPKIIFNDATNLKNISYLESLSAFGKFTFENSHVYDSIFATKTSIRIDLFKEKMLLNANSRPDWFINIDSAGIKDNEVIEDEKFYILKNNKSKTIYFVLSQ